MNTPIYHSRAFACHESCLSKPWLRSAVLGEEGFTRTLLRISVATVPSLATGLASAQNGNMTDGGSRGVVGCGGTAECRC